MAETSAPPSRNPANVDSMPGMMEFVLKKFLQSNIDDMLPARVIAYDRAKNRVRVQPMIVMVTTAGQQVPRDQVVSVPVFQFGGGGCLLSFNLVEGDLGWIKASDRDISLFLANYNASPPNTQRLHDFADALFFPDIMRGYSINAEDAANAVLQTADGTQRIALWPDKVKITSSTRIVLDAPITTITGIMETLNEGGVATASIINGTLQATVDVMAQTVSLKNHTHGGVQTGGGNTGAPNT